MIAIELIMVNSSGKYYPYCEYAESEVLVEGVHAVIICDRSCERGDLQVICSKILRLVLIGRDLVPTVSFLKI